MKLTSVAKPNEIIRNWILIDAEGQIFGRMLTKVATMLRGKNKPLYTPNVDCGDYVVIINARKVIFTGNKLKTKDYFTHSGYFGSTKSKKLGDMLENKTQKLYKLSVRGMLPKTTLGKEMLKRLKVYSDAEHPHTAQLKSQEGSK